MDLYFSASFYPLLIVKSLDPLRRRVQSHHFSIGCGEEVGDVTGLTEGLELSVHEGDEDDGETGVMLDELTLWDKVGDVDSLTEQGLEMCAREGEDNGDTDVMQIATMRPSDESNSEDLPTQSIPLR